jgi:hypothetical protein
MGVLTRLHEPPLPHGPHPSHSELRLTLWGDASQRRGGVSCSWNGKRRKLRSTSKLVATSAAAAITSSPRGL